MRRCYESRLRGLVIHACMVAVAACTHDSEDPFIPRYESERLKIGTSFDDGLCIGDRQMWEEHVDIIENVLGVSRKDAWVFVYLADEGREVAEDCGYEIEDAPFGLKGCWQDPVVRGTLEAIPHELVHAWTLTDLDEPLPALREGIAVRMTGTVPYLGAPNFSTDELFLTKFPVEKYDRAGHFVAWLLVEYGPETVMELFARTSTRMSSDELAAVFIEVVGKSPVDLVAAYENSAKAYYPAMGAAACGQGPVIPWEGNVVSWPAEGSCSEGPFFGFESSEWWQRVTLEVTVPGAYQLDPGGRPASMTRCLTEPADEVEIPGLDPMLNGDWEHDTPLGDLDAAFGFGFGEDWADFTLQLDPGIYEVWVERRSYENPQLEPEMKLRRL